MRPVRVLNESTPPSPMDVTSLQGLSPSAPEAAALEFSPNEASWLSKYGLCFALMDGFEGRFTRTSAISGLCPVALKS